MAAFDSVDYEKDVFEKRSDDGINSAVAFVASINHQKRLERRLEN
jgi:hypothetical protein